MSKELEELKKEYESLKSAIEEYCMQMDELLLDDKVKLYAQLQGDKSKAESRFNNISLQYKRRQMCVCKHVFIIGSRIREWDEHRVNKNDTHYCIKCGLDSRFLYFSCPDILEQIQRDMGAIYKETAKKGRFVSIECHPLLAKKIYEGIIKVHPDISDEDLIKYFSAALHNIETNDEEKHLKHLGVSRTRGLIY